MIVYGDSYTSGENNGFVSFADYLGIDKNGISGTCLGDYSIYPVNGGLISQLNDSTGTVLIEYGVNDAASLVTGFASINSVKIAIAKASDLLKDANTYFLMLSNNPRDLQLFSTNYANYLNNDYLKGLYDINAEDFLWQYMWFCNVMQRKFKTLYMLPDGFNEYDTDGIHPTDKGCRMIAENLSKQLL